MRLIIQSIIVMAFALSFGLPASARPETSQVFCEAFPDVPNCKGAAIACSFCHTQGPPTLNSFGASLKAASAAHPGDLRDSAQNMREIVTLVFAEDSDQDGVSNQDEINAGTLPGNATSKAPVNACATGSCSYDFEYAYKKTWGSVCGEPPSYDEYQSFRALSSEQKPDKISKLLDSCLTTNNWLGKDGVVWEIGHYKIRPVGSVKSGEDPGVIPIVDYYADYNLFLYSQSGGRDARELLLSDYTVTRATTGNTTTYTKQPPQRLTDGQVMQPEYRVGLLTSFWNLAFYLNYTGIARVLVAQAFNAYLGISLANMQGLNPPDAAEANFKDYDGKGVERPECAMCHRTIDPLSYPFRNYNGLSGTSQVLQGQNAAGLRTTATLGTEENLTPLSYALPRMDYLNLKYPGIKDMPEAGYIFGQRVETLKEWAEVLVNSDAFAANTVKDYWRVLVGHEPRPEEMVEFERLWQDFKGKHNYDVEAMLHELVKTAAFGTP